MRDTMGQRAVVIGGSIAGLAAACVLADHFDQVVVLERDVVGLGPAPHKSVPQARHIHALLASGHRVLSALFPGFTERLMQSGAIHYRVGVDTAYHFQNGKAYTLFGAWREPCDTGIDVYSQSRALLEHLVRQCTAVLAKVAIKTGTEATNLHVVDGSVRGVRYVDGEGERMLEADLVVDAAGRGSHAPRWLAALGYPSPPESSIGVQFAYASARYRIPAAYDDTARAVLVVSPDFPTGGVLQEIEDRTWIVSLGARFGGIPPTDEAGFLAFARALHSPRIHELLVGAERIEAIARYRYPTSVWRHYEQSPSSPARLILVGDALCSFNPVWGQGMSVALLQAEALAQILARNRRMGRGLERLGRDFFDAAAKVIGAAWTLAANLDFAYPQTVGIRPRFMALRTRYSAALDALARRDPAVTRLLYEVYHLLKPVSALTAPRLGGRALMGMFRDLAFTA
jgi:2-polyprenyl-6-methoxyphenol hydroxylase-like FAD-dependent oxidoreductase